VRFVEAGTSFAGFFSREAPETVVFCFGILALGVVEGWVSG